ncbi:MAG: gamma-glutamyltransferase, partial [Candidatus Thorarchaeota archaeon]
HYAPNKRPFHTIIPGALYRDGDLMGVFGVMGGDHQAQAHAQVVSNVVDHGLGPQMAIDHPRFHHDQATDTLVLEMGHPRRLLTELRRRGHNLIPNEGRLFGGGQMILRQDSIWVAGSDRRKDGQACGF